MASAAVGPQRPNPPHLDPEQQRLFGRLTTSERKRILRKSSGEMKPRKSAPAAATDGLAVSATAAATASLNHLHPSGSAAAPELGGGGVSVGCPVLQPCRLDNVAAHSPATCCRCAARRAGGQAVASQVKPTSSGGGGPRADGENVKPRDDTDSGSRGTSHSPPCSHCGADTRDSKAEPSGAEPTGSVPDTSPPHRPGGRRSSQITLHPGGDFSAMGDGGGFGAQRMPVVTQGRSGVVKLMRHDPPRREAWSIFQQEDPRVREERGEGHCFAPGSVSRDWCDVCNRLVHAEALKCKNCSYTCHLECKDLIQLDCNQQDRQLEDTPSPGRPGPTPQHKNAAKEEEEKPKELSKDEIRAKIDDYNAKVSECVGMKLSEDGTYTGFIKVHLKLRRPVTVTGDGSDRKTSFYLPLDAVKQLHISSTTMVSEVIQGLLRKFMVLDNPRKFALYRRTHRDSQDLFQKLPVSDHPLLLRLLTGPDPEKLTFVLKENETGDVEWHAFSVPELQNFLTILEKEERDRIKQVQQKYEAYRERLKRALHESQGKPG
ncbi:ras association domain-containing protein 5 [Amia ocellicauda]|uniref:ras association domain-containing protein 5 n=1 Tax=Amia ocellicauda TaxID=2972642 RepID=UPI003463AFD9